MSLTHERVRALLVNATAYLQHTSKHDANMLTARALADEWLAARTVRWDGDTLHGPGFYGEAVYDSDEWGAFVRRLYAVSGLTEHDARAWLETKAREAGYEIEGGA